MAMVSRVRPRDEDGGQIMPAEDGGQIMPAAKRAREAELSREASNLAIHCLGINAEDLRRMNDSKVQNFIETVSGVCSACDSFEHLMLEMPDAVGKKRMESKGNQQDGTQIQAPADQTLRQYAESKHIAISRFAERYLSAFNNVRELYQMNSSRKIKKLILSSTFEEGDTVTAQNIEDAFGLPELEAAHKLLTADTAEWADSCQLFYLNCLDAISLEHGQGGVTALVEELQGGAQKIAAAQQELDELVKAQGDLLGKKARNASLLQAAEAMARSKEEGVQVLEQNLAKANANLEDAQSRLKRYTWNMYCLFTDMWKNDVALAKADRDRFTAEKEELVRKLQEARDGRVLASDAEVHQHKEEKVKLQHQYETLTNSVAKQHQKLQDEENAVKNTKAKLGEILSSKGAISVDHLFKINDAVLSHASINTQIATRHATGKHGWKQHLAMTIEFVKRLKAAKTKDMMTFKLASLWDFLSNSEPKFRFFMEKCNMVTDIRPSAFVAYSVPRSLPSEAYSLCPDPFTEVPALPALDSASSAAAGAPNATPALQQAPSSAQVRSAAAMASALDTLMTEPALPEED